LEAVGRKIVPDRLLRATEDPHLNLVLAILNIVPVAQRMEWLTTNMPRTACLIDINHAWSRLARRDSPR